ncbi:MAG: hypothetical protein JJE15_02590 [Desulfobacteraceae bacterium]|nr:hypothetical protein [Desulfobacteraceae bacterium]
MCVDACTFGALTYEEREKEVEEGKEAEVKLGDMEIVFESLVKKYGKKKLMNTFTRLSKGKNIKSKEED